jgi:hypothetical protein
MLTTVAYAETLRKRMRSDEDAQRKCHKDEVSVDDDSVFDINDLGVNVYRRDHIPELTVEDWLIVDPTNLSLLNDGRSMVLKIDGSIKMQDTPSNLDGMRDILTCKRVQMVPMTIGPYAGMFELWLDEDGYYTKVLNPSASELFGDQVFGGRLHGVVMVIGCKYGPP